MPVPDLQGVQKAAYLGFLQRDASPMNREDHGLEALLKEMFPIESYDGNLGLHYVNYELGKARYTPDECRELRLTYGMPLRIRVRLIRKDTEEIQEDLIYLGDMPIMIGGGEFIINGAERVVVSQLHRSPGIDFVSEIEAGDRRLHSCRIIPERGSWIELNSTKKDTLIVRIDQSGKFSAMTLLRAMNPKYSLNADLIRIFYDATTEKIVDGRSVSKIEGKIAVDDIVYPVRSDRAGEIILESGQKITKNVAELICTSGIGSVQVIEDPKVPLIFNSLADDTTSSHEEALLRIYQRLRPGNPPQLEKARSLFHEKFFDTNRYRLGKVGRFRINRKLGLNVPESEMTLRPDDLIAAIKYLLELTAGVPG
ncbi:MAG: DNA-directed RNA polymerase subunit beta, partial [Planctomycetes bacterium]|nr:DNA-directed RNA polymerase subunit beta [Planctomycetota bacterium]